MLLTVCFCSYFFFINRCSGKMKQNRTFPHHFQKLICIFHLCRQRLCEYILALYISNAWILLILNVSLYVTISDVYIYSFSIWFFVSYGCVNTYLNVFLWCFDSFHLRSHAFLLKHFSFWFFWEVFGGIFCSFFCYWNKNHKT